MALKIIHQLNKSHSASVIFFHGSGDTGSGILDWIKFLINDFAQPHIRFLFPTAPVRKYTPMNGELSHVWFDRLDISPEAPEHEETLEEMGTKIKELIAAEVATGVPINRIIVGGFSMGGALAMHVGYRWVPEVAGVFALSAFLNNNSAVYRDFKKDRKHAPLFMCHGGRDSLVPLEWGKETHEKLQKLGVETKFQELKNTLHELKKHEMINLMEWIKTIVPE